MKLITKTIFLIVSFVFFDCFGIGLSGTYMGQEGSFLEKLTCSSNEPLEFTLFAPTTEASYTKEVKKIKINNASEYQIPAINHTVCLDGGGYLGSYCKE